VHGLIRQPKSITSLGGMGSIQKKALDYNYLGEKREMRNRTRKRDLRGNRGGGDGERKGGEGGAADVGAASYVWGRDRGGAGGRRWGDKEAGSRECHNAKQAAFR